MNISFNPNLKLSFGVKFEESALKATANRVANNDEKISVRDIERVKAYGKSSGYNPEVIANSKNKFFLNDPRIDVDIPIELINDMAHPVVEKIHEAAIKADHIEAAMECMK